MAKLEGVKIIDAKDGVIEKIAYDGAEYVAEEVPLSEFKAGDIMLKKDGTFMDIKEIRSRGDMLFIDHGDLVGAVSGGFRYVSKLRFRKVVTYSIGDIVVITNTIGGTLNGFGDIGMITETRDGQLRCRVEVPKGSQESNWSLVDSLRHATPAEIAEYEKAVAPKVVIKAGDFVKNIGDHDSSLTIGKVYEVMHVDRDGCVTVVDDERDGNSMHPDYFEKAEKVERPFEVGDIVRVLYSPNALPSGTLFEVMRSFEGTVSDGEYFYDTNHSEKPRIELVAPASARKDVKQ